MKGFKCALWSEKYGSIRIRMTTNKNVKHSNAPQETVTDCSYAGFQANASTVGLLANKYIALNHEWNIVGNYSKNAQNIKALMCPLYLQMLQLVCISSSQVPP